MSNDKIEKILQSLGQENVPEDIKELAEDTSQNFSDNLSGSQHHIQWSNIMKTKFTKFVAAAVIIIAVLIGIDHFGVSIDGTTVAWANTLEQIYSATSVTFKKTFTVEDNPSFATEVMINENGVIRSSQADWQTIFDFGAGKQLHLMPASKEAILTHRVGQKRHAKPYNRLQWFASIKDRAGEFLGFENINGVRAEKNFWEKEEYRNVTVWIDPSNNLPVKVKEVYLPNPDQSIVPPYISLSLSDFGGDGNRSFSITTGGGPGIQKKMVIVMTDFLWNQELDPVLFSTEPPEDYTLREKQQDVSELGENDLVQALAFWTEMSGGSFPENINDLMDQNQINPMLIDKFDRDDDPLDEIDKAMKQATIISKGLYFAQSKKAEQNWNYAGGGVYLGDSETMVCWWELEDSNDYRVIFGDLSIGTISADQLPK